MDELGRAYVKLAFGIEGHQPGYIDGYYGPDEWKPATPPPVAALRREADELAAVVAKVAIEARRTFLQAQVRAMQATLARLQGEQIPYREEVQWLYDIEPTHVPEAEFEEAIAALDTLLPGSGEIAPREQAFRATFEVPPERLPALLHAIRTELAHRTHARWKLPAGENFEMTLVTGEPWGAYNWYLGDYRSRIDINTDLPSRVMELPALVAHEAYPGHHTEHAIKEERLWREARRGEHSILLINAPECVVSEGIATRALQLVMEEAELLDWIQSDLVPLAGLGEVDVRAAHAIAEAKQALRAVSGNAALLLHEEGASAEEVSAYLQRYGLRKPEEARKGLAFLTHPNFRSYTFTYTVGASLLDQLFERGEPHRWFSRLLTEPITPGTLRAWIAEGEEA